MARCAVILDLDGTLIDSRVDLTTAVNLARAQAYLTNLSVEEVACCVGNGVTRLAERCLTDAGMTTAAAVAAIKRHYAEHLLDTTDLYPGTRAALTAIRDKGYRIALATNKPEAAARRICEQLRVAPWLDELIGGDSCANLKPHPEPVLLALRRLGARRQGSWVVGDNYTDLAAARRAGLQSCFCRYGFGRCRNEKYDLAVDSFEEFAEELPERAPAPEAR